MFSCLLPVAVDPLGYSSCFSALRNNLMDNVEDQELTWFRTPSTEEKTEAPGD